MNKIQAFQSKLNLTDKFKDIRPGWTVKVYQKIKEGEKTRLQAFEGMVIARKHGHEGGGTVTVRKVTEGIGVEKTFPIYLPTIDKVTVVKKAKVRRAKLFYLRDKTTKEIRRKIKTSSEVASEKGVTLTA